jgi:hypothetical protein
VVACYLADLKFGNDACAARYARVPHYFKAVTRNLQQAARSAQVIVRHVLLPGHFECCFRPVVDWVADHTPALPFVLYPGYVPCGPAARDQQIGRLNNRVEVAAAREYLANRRLHSPPARHAVSRPGVTPLLGGEGELSLTVGADGQFYCHDLTPELAATLSKLCHEDGQ